MNFNRIYKQYMSPASISRMLMAFAILLSNMGVIAQVDSTKLEFNQVEVVKSFELKLKDVEPVPFSPPVLKIDQTPLKYDYKITPVREEIQFPKPEIRALAMQPDEPVEPYNGFVKAGYGMRKSPYVEGGYHNVRKDLYHWGAYGKYEHANDTERILNQKYTNIDIDLYGSYVWKNNTRLGGVFENLNTRRILWNENESLDSNVIDRNTNFVRLEANLANIDLDNNDLNYQVKAGFYNFRISDQKTFENQLYIEGKVEKHRSEYLAYHWPLRLETTLMKSESWNSLFNLQTEPHIIFRIGRFRGVVGAAALVSVHKSAIFPKIDASYPVFSNHVQVFAGMDMRTFNNSLYNLLTINPFLDVNIVDLTNTITKDMYVGLKGDFAHISYQGQVGYKIFDNMAFFTSDTIDVALFDLVFDRNISPYITGNIEYRMTKQWKFGGWITQNFFNTDTLPLAFHVPALSLSSYAKGSLLDDKLHITTRFTVLGSYQFFDTNGVENRENPMLDLQAEVEYFPIHNLGVYVKGNNLLNQNFQRWQGYRNLGMQVSGGIMFKF